MPRREPPPPKPPPTPAEFDLHALSFHEQRFVEEYLRHGRAGRAYRTVNPHVTRESAWVLGSRMLGKAQVRAEIKAELRERRKHSQAEAMKVIRAAVELLQCDLADCVDENDDPLPLHKIPVETRKWIQSVRRDDSTETTRSKGKIRTTRRTRHHLRLVNKGLAFAFLIKHLGLEQTLPPIELLLSTMPRDMAELLRQALAGTLKVDDMEKGNLPFPPSTVAPESHGN